MSVRVVVFPLQVTVWATAVHPLGDEEYASDGGSVVDISMFWKGGVPLSVTLSVNEIVSPTLADDVEAVTSNVEIVAADAGAGNAAVEANRSRPSTALSAAVRDFRICDHLIDRPLTSALRSNRSVRRA